MTFSLCCFVQVLKTWGELAGDPELGTAIEWDRPFYWMEKLAKEKFWLGGRGKYVLDVLKQMRVKGLCINHVSELHYITSFSRDACRFGSWPAI